MKGVGHMFVYVSCAFFQTPLIDRNKDRQTDRGGGEGVCVCVYVCVCV